MDNDDKLRAIDNKVDVGDIDPQTAENQRKLNEAVRYALKDFVGRDMTPTLLAEAEGQVRTALIEMTLNGTYVLPRNMQIDRVELGTDMRIKVYFKRAVLV